MGHRYCSASVVGSHGAWVEGKAVHTGPSPAAPSGECTPEIDQVDACSLHDPCTLPDSDPSPVPPSSLRPPRQGSRLTVSPWRGEASDHRPWPFHPQHWVGWPWRGKNYRDCDISPTHSIFASASLGESTKTTPDQEEDALGLCSLLTSFSLLTFSKCL